MVPTSGASGQARSWSWCVASIPQRVLLVGVDVAKATWFVVASNLLGEVVVDGVRLVADRAGLAELERVLGAASARVNAAMVVVGIEAAGHQHQTLTAHLLDRDELVVRAAEPGASGRGPQAAGQPAAQDRLAGRGGHLRAAGPRRGRAGAPGRLASGGVAAAVVGAAKTWWIPAVGCASRPGRWSTASGRAVSAKDTVAGVTPVLCDLFATKAGRVLLELLAQGWTPARVAATSVAALRGLFAVRGCRLTRPLAARLIGRAQAALPAHPAATAGKAATLAALLGTIDTLDREIACLEVAMAPAAGPPPRAPSSPSSAGWAWSPRPDSWPSWAHTDRWAEWSKVWRAAGLDPARSQSGRRRRPATASAGRARPGAGGRSWTWPQPSASSPGRWRDRLRTRTTQQHKPAKVALAATANARSGAPCFALMACGRRLYPDPSDLRSQTAHAAAEGRWSSSLEPDDPGGLRGVDQTPLSGYEARPRA